MEAGGGDVVGVSEGRAVVSAEVVFLCTSWGNFFALSLLSCLRKGKSVC